LKEKHKVYNLEKLAVLPIRHKGYGGKLLELLKIT